MILNNNSAVPLYQQIAENLKNRIEQGEFVSGQCLPSEAKLCEHYGVSRPTVRSAIAELVEQEILVTYQGKGAFVRGVKISSNLNTFKGFTYFCKENNIETSNHVLEKVIMSPSQMIQKKLELSEGKEVVYLKRLRYVNHKPVMIEHIFIPFDEYGFLMNVDMENASLYEKIEEHVDIKIQDNCYTSIMLEANITTEEEMKLLDLEDPQAVFVLSETVYMNTGKPFHFTKQVLLGDYFKFFLSNKANQLSMNWKKV